MVKYRNSSFDNEYGHWDSKLEYYRYLVLLDAQRRGVIRNIERQVRFELIPEQREKVTLQRITKRGVTYRTRERVVELSCCYDADFVYEKDGRTIIEDTKGYHTKDYIIKRKLMRLQGNPIREVRTPNETV